MLALGIKIKSATDSVGRQILSDALWEHAVISHSYRCMTSGRANRCTENHIIVCYNKLVPRRVERAWYLFKKQSVRRPIELSLKQVGNANFGAVEIEYKKL